MQNFKNPGNVVTLTAPSALTSGQGIQIGQAFVVAVDAAASGATFPGSVVGVHTLPKNTGQAFSEGDLLYWDSTPGELTTTALGNLLVGVSTTDELAATATGTVRLDGAARPQEP
jgi:predicted RecA/RadA family phage recombinase